MALQKGMVQVGVIKMYFFKKDFAAFLVIGAVNTLNGVVLSFICSMFLQANAAFICGYVAALTVAFFLNSYFVFHVKPKPIRFTKFIISYFPNFIIQNALVLIFYNGFHWNKLFVYALAAAIGLPITFLFVKLFAFKKTNNANI